MAAPKEAASATMATMWRDAEARFKQATGKSLIDNQSKTLEDCLNEVDNLGEPEELSEGKGPDAKAKKEKTKQRWLNALQLFKMLGGAAAQGAELAGFLPAGICFAALSGLFDVPAKIHSYHEAIDRLCDDLWPSLSAFRIYDKIEQFNDMEPELRLTIHRLMISFVDICALSIKLRDSGSKWDKLKTSFKVVMFDEDSGIQAEIAKFRFLSSAHASIQGTQSLKLLMEGNSALKRLLLRASETGEQMDRMDANITILKDSEDKRKSDSAWQKNRDNIQKKLDIEKSLKLSEDTGNQLWSDCVPGTANWFENLPEFSSWADYSSATQASPLLRLTGDENSGKSVVMSSIHRHLDVLSKSSVKAAPRMLVAAYFLPPFAGKDHEDRDPVKMAIKCLAYQLAKQDEVYAKVLSQDCDRPGAYTKIRDATCQELWSFLGIGSEKAKSIHYVVMDGLAGLPKSHKESRDALLTILMDSNNRYPKLRTVVSLRPDMTIAQLPLVGENIDIERHNLHDVKEYIDNTLRSKDLFQDDDESFVDLRERIRKRLAQNVKSNFGKVKAALDQIAVVVASGGPESRIDTILDESNRDSKAIAQTVIHQLQDKRSAEEILELNELLAWVVFGRHPFRLEELTSALFFHFKTKPLQSLRKKIEEKYGTILSIQSDNCVAIEDDTKEMLKMKRTRPRAVDETPKFTVDISITKADLKSVQSFLWSLLQKTSHDSFGFQEVMKHGSTKGEIRVNEFDAHMTIVKSTFVFLSEPYNEKHAGIGRYMLRHLSDHLAELEGATGFDALTPGQLQEIGDGLFHLLGDEAVESHWQAFSCLVRCSAKDVDVFRHWLAKPGVTDHLGRLERKWLKGVAADVNPNRALLLDMATAVARMWLKGKKEKERELAGWIIWYLGLVTAEPGNEKDTSDAGAPITVKQAADWCRERLTVVDAVVDDVVYPDALWFRRLGWAFYCYEEYSLASEAFNKAIESDNTLDMCHVGLAYCQAVAGNYAEACQQMERELELLGSNADTGKESITSHYIYLAAWHGYEGNSDRVVHYGRKVLQTAPENVHAQSRALDIHFQQDRDDTKYELLQDLLGVQEGKNSFAPVVSLWAEEASEYYSDWLFLKSLSVTSGKPEMIQPMVHAVNDAVKAASKQDKNNQLAILSLWKGILLFFYHQDPSLIDEALHCWKLGKLGTQVSPESGVVSSSSRLLSAYYFERLRGAKVAEHHFEVNLDPLKSLAKEAGPHYLSHPMAYLCSHYTVNGDAPTARATVQACMRSALDLLSDDVENNDVEAYYHIGCILVHLGDYANALGAFSQRLPEPNKGDVVSRILKFETAELSRGLVEELVAQMEREIKVDADVRNQFAILQRLVKDRLSDSDRQAGTSDSVYEEIESVIQKWADKVYMPGGIYCDACEAALGFENSMYQCKYCFNTCFCANCIKLLKEDKHQKNSVATLVCNRTHDWVHIPKVDVEQVMEVLNGNVLIGGKVEDGRRVGGQCVPSEEWIAGLKRDWGYV